MTGCNRPRGRIPHDCVMLTYAGGTSSTSRSKTSTFCRAMAPRMRRRAGQAGRRGMAEAPRQAEGAHPRDRA
jgi:hypothetical protein